MKKQQEHRSVEYAFTVMGLIIALVVISLLAGGLGYFLSGGMDVMNVTTNNTFYKYNLTYNLSGFSDEMNGSVWDTKRDETTGIIDIIGNYFSAGWRSVIILFKSVKLTGAVIDGACADFPFICVITTIFKILIVIIVLILFLQALLKWYI